MLARFFAFPLTGLRPCCVYGAISNQFLSQTRLWHGINIGINCLVENPHLLAFREVFAQSKAMTNRALNQIIDINVQCKGELFEGFDRPFLTFCSQSPRWWSLSFRWSCTLARVHRGLSQRRLSHLNMQYRLAIQIKGQFLNYKAR